MKVLQFAETHKSIIAATIAIIMIAVLSIALYKGFVFSNETKPFELYWAKYFNITWGPHA